MKQSLIWKHYHKPLHNFILFKVKDKDLAEDIIQEVWLALLRSMLENQNISNLVVWLFDKAAKEVANFNERIEYQKCSLKEFRNEDPKKSVISYLYEIQEMSIPEISKVVEESSDEIVSLIEENSNKAANVNKAANNSNEDYLIIN
ncbi:hypothetical protein [Mangrovivirga cuniculi]|uniref:RNA polymerase sigma-70 region 2 domain-containing protein n=1 Tax=Mangrovivirga cuniculi TaxID=2715131 RepID=A0A4D7JU87_9BACT|nr:hypothetical protein [Mangrovivirga cuniculi]QCK14435.1 hypothetical protein DCC35_06620 [Mangrovivirga cuniculi]